MTVLRWITFCAVTFTSAVFVVILLRKKKRNTGPTAKYIGIFCCSRLLRHWENMLVSHVITWHRPVKSHALRVRFSHLRSISRSDAHG